MKTVMIIIDGLGDEPIPDLDYRTPMQAAFTPNIHFIANRGQIGRIQTTYSGFPIESMVCIMGLLGYEPEKFYPNGRASFEAMAKGIPLHPKDLVFRCNTVTVDMTQQTLTDFTAGLISDSDARKLIGNISLPYDNWELYPGQSYRNTLVIRGADISPKKVKCFEPHMNIGKKIHKILPEGFDENSRLLVEQINSFLMDTQRQISKMDLSKKCAANMLWVWSQSIKPIWPAFNKTSGTDAAIVGGLDFLHGIAMAAGIHFDVIPGATGYVNTNYQAKAEQTIKYIQEFDFVLAHVNAADEEAHQNNHLGKITAIESIDRLVVAPVLYELVKNHNGNFRIVVCGDHATRCSDGKHSADPVPFALYGKGIKASNSDMFFEDPCCSFSPSTSHHFLRDILWG
jgi:2,3-bisphosphoglycerate-independent phosphoglycerate mutase